MQNQERQKSQGSNTLQEKQGALWVLLLSFSSLVQEAPCLPFPTQPSRAGDGDPRPAVGMILISV